MPSCSEPHPPFSNCCAAKEATGTCNGARACWNLFHHRSWVVMRVICVSSCVWRNSFPSTVCTLPEMWTAFILAASNHTVSVTWKFLQMGAVLFVTEMSALCNGAAYNFCVIFMLRELVFLLCSSGKCVCKCCRSTPTRGWRRQMRCFGASSSLNSMLGSTYFTAAWRKPDKKKWLASSLLPFTPPYPVSLFLHRNPLLS